MKKGKAIQSDLKEEIMGLREEWAEIWRQTLNAEIPKKSSEIHLIDPDRDPVLIAGPFAQRLFP